MKKTTQNVTKSIWRSGLLAFVFLCSLSIHSQTVGDEYLTNPGINTATGANSTTPTTGVDGNGNMLVNGSLVNIGGWGNGNGAYAPASTQNGTCHSNDRMFKLFKKGGAAGQFVNQTITLPAGNYNWSFWTKWGALVDWDDAGDVTPKFLIKTDDDDNGSWTNVQETITTQPTVAHTWVEQTGTYVNDVERQVRIQFYKYGGVNGNETNLNQLWYIDDVSLQYSGPTGALSSDTSLSDLTINGVSVSNFFTAKATYNIGLNTLVTDVPTLVATTTNANATAVITAGTTIPGITSILITAEDGSTATVTINFYYLKSLKEYLVNPGINTATGTNSTTPTTGVDGGGNFPAHLGGWTTAAGGAYASASVANGDCHSADRMFKFNRKGNNNGEYVVQIIKDVPAGYYTWSYWNKWLEYSSQLPSWSLNEDSKPKFSISTSDDNGATWTATQYIPNEPTTNLTWVQEKGTFYNDLTRDIRIKFYKIGKIDATETNLNKVWYIDDVSFKYAGSVKWTGTTDLNWDTNSNWSSNSAPVAASYVFIPSGLTNYPTLGSAVDINSVTMANGSSLIANSTFSGNVTYTRNLATTNWYLVSSPVIGQDIDTFAAAEGLLASGSNINNMGLASYDNTSSAWSYYQSGASGTGAFASASGRSIKLAAAGDVSFTGTMAVDNVSIAITNGYNLVGNPYPSYIAANTGADSSNNILTVNTSILSEATLWFWNQATNTYDAINQASSSMDIAPAQGFFVSAAGTNSLSITEAMQSHQSSDSFQRLSNERPEISIVLSDGENTRDTDIYYIDGTTTGFDNGYDSTTFGGLTNDFDIYTHLVANSNGEDFAIQSLPNSSLETMIIPVGITAAAGEEISISANAINLPEGVNIYLEDKSDDSFTLLDSTSVFTTTPDEDLNGIGRFYIHTTATALSDNQVSLTNVSMYLVDRNLTITGVHSGDTNVRVYDLLGKEVHNTSFQGTGFNKITLPSLTTGVYVVQLETQMEAISKKIIIKK